MSTVASQWPYRYRSSHHQPCGRLSIHYHHGCWCSKTPWRGEQWCFYRCCRRTAAFHPKHEATATPSVTHGRSATTPPPAREASSMLLSKMYCTTATAPSEKSTVPQRVLLAPRSDNTTRYGTIIVKALSRAVL